MFQYLFILLLSFPQANVPCHQVSYANSCYLLGSFFFISFLGWCRS